MKIELLKTRLAELENKHEKQSEMMSDLLDYLMRVDVNFKSCPGTVDGWYMRLMKLRNEEKKRAECARAQEFLEEQGYIVASDPNGLDAAKLKKWVSLEEKPDDDIPF